MSGISGSLPGGLTISEISLTRPTFQDTTSSTMAIIVWSSVGAAIGVVLAVLLGYCITTQARYFCSFLNFFSFVYVSRRGKRVLRAGFGDS